MDFFYFADLNEEKPIFLSQTGEYLLPFVGTGRMKVNGSTVFQQDSEDLLLLYRFHQSLPYLGSAGDFYTE